MAQITPIISLDQGAVTPKVDPNMDLLATLQKILDTNQPKTDINQATPDQTAAAQETSNIKQDAKKPILPAGATVQSGKPGENPTLPNIIDQLFSSTKDKNSLTNDASKASNDNGSSGLNALFGEGGVKNSKIGKVVDTAKKAASIAMLFL